MHAFPRGNSAGENLIHRLCIRRAHTSWSAILSSYHLFSLGYNDNHHDEHEDGDGHGTDVQTFGSCSVGLGPNHIARHLPVPGLEETR